VNGQTHGGKGSAQRSVDQSKFESNWDAIFAPKVPPKAETSGSPFEWYNPETVEFRHYDCASCGSVQNHAVDTIREFEPNGEWKEWQVVTCLLCGWSE